MRKLLLALLATTAGPVFAEPLSYDYAYLSSTDVESDNGNESSGDTFGGFLEFADTLHGFLSWDDGDAYAGGGSNPAWQYETRTLRAGVGAHYLLGSKFMLAPSIAILRADREISSPAWSSPRETSDTGYGVQLDLRYAMTHWFEVTAGARSSHLFDQSDTEYVGGIVFHPTDWLAAGVVHHEGEERTGTEFTLKWYY